MEYDQLGPEKACSTRRLGPPDLAALQELFNRSADYFEISTGAPAPDDEAQRAFVAGPPSKSVDDKRTIGVFNADKTLIGVIDAIVDWPEPGVWAVGMLLLEPDARGQGLGTSVLEAFEQWAAKEGATRVRTALVSHHERGVTFAHRSGYRPDRTLDDYDAGAQQSRVLFMEKRLGS